MMIRVDALLLALRGIVWRRGTSAVVLAIGLFATAAATSGPLYLSAANESILRDALRAEPAYISGIDVQSFVRAGQRAEPRLADTVARGLTGHRHYLPPLLTNSVATRVVRADGRPVADTSLVYRPDVCAHVLLALGRCPDAGGEVLLSESGSKVVGVGLGDVLLLGGPTERDGAPLAARVVGLYRPRDPIETYWFGRPYFVSLGGVPGDGTRIDAVFTPDATFDQVGASAFLRQDVNVLLDVRNVRQEDSASLARATDDVRDAIREASLLSDEVPPATYGYIGIVLALTERDQDALRAPVTLVVAQLLALAWFVLYTVVANATAARSVEVALAKLRGFTVRSTVALALLETLLLLAVAVPLGGLLAYGGVQAMARTGLADGTPVVPGPGVVLASVAALAGAAVAAVLAARRVVQRPVPELLRRGTSQRTTGRAVVVEAALLVLVGIAVVRLRRDTGLHDRALDAKVAGRDLAVLLVPGLLALGLALVGARFLATACRAAFAWTRNANRVSWFLAVRHVARRQAGLRLVIVLATAFGLATFTTLAWSVFGSNRLDRSLAENGAAAVLSVRVPADVDLVEVVRRADPSGRRAMAVVANDSPNAEFRVVGVDTERLGDVSFWRRDLTPQPLGELVETLRSGAAAPLPAIAGSDVGAVEGEVLTSRGLDGRPIDLLVVAVTDGIPGFGPRALLVDVEHARALATGPLAYLRNEVWLRTGAPDVVRQLEADGIQVDRTVRAATREEAFARQSPSLALLLFLVGSALAAILAGAGAGLDLHLLGRRRAFELAALMATGVRRATVLRAVLAEQALVLGAGTGLGVLAGLVAAWSVLPVLPQFVDRPLYPDLVFAPDVGLVAVVIASVAAAVAVVVGASAVALVRIAVPSRLREAQA